MSEWNFEETIDLSQVDDGGLLKLASSIKEHEGPILKLHITYGPKTPIGIGAVCILPLLKSIVDADIKNLDITHAMLLGIDRVVQLRRRDHGDFYASTLQKNLRSITVEVMDFWDEDHLHGGDIDTIYRTRWMGIDLSDHQMNRIAQNARDTVNCNIALLGTNSGFWRMLLTGEANLGKIITTIRKKAPNLEIIYAESRLIDAIEKNHAFRAMVNTKDHWGRTVLPWKLEVNKRAYPARYDNTTESKGTPNVDSAFDAIRGLTCLPSMYFDRKIPLPVDVTLRSREQEIFGIVPESVKTLTIRGGSYVSERSVDNMVWCIPHLKTQLLKEIVFEEDRGLDMSKLVTLGKERGFEVIVAGVNLTKQADSTEAQAQPAKKPRRQ